ncbi:hypothetical protein Sarmat_00100 [Rickettsiales endosymbiont of Paramecium tredecaurelia]|uniref:DUF2460 domain-containing protein n=1 Tax=Candidatus Sarmatiella mevalonica TaxID=2770581 RepID=UPI001920B07E|nr:DUF2460 domain-containing protein [Candidatus Sarmatiella mevalonica]MBL3284260.1 hypothetical protein [Candidatus Sarmatiella mevalonica]
MQSFHDVRMPIFLSRFAISSPTFKNFGKTTYAGKEIVNAFNSNVSNIYKISNCIISMLEFRQLQSFFMARRGRLYTFRFKDLSDFQVRMQKLDNTYYDGLLHKVTLHKIYADSTAPYYRPITKPVASSIRLYNNKGAKLKHQVLDGLNGIIKISDEQEAGEYQDIFIDFEFDVEVRFNQNHLTYSVLNKSMVQLEDFELTEVCAL